MRAYVVRRVLLLIPTFFLLTILVFLSVRFIPGDAIDVLLSRMVMTSGGGSGIDRPELERRLGLDVPVHVQYGRWMGGILLRGDLGTPMLRPEPVGELIAGRLPATIELGLVAVIVGLLIGGADWHLLGGAAGHRRRLRGSFLRHLRTGHPQLLAGHHHPGVSGDLVGVVAAVAAGAAERRPGAPLEHVHRAGADPGHLPGGQHHAHDPHHDAGSAAAGLHSHRLGQGPAGAPGDPPPRDQERADPGGDSGRTADTDHRRRLGDRWSRCSPSPAWGG